MDPELTLQSIPSELDSLDWALEKDLTDVQVFSKFGACGSPVIGFKTVTYHIVSAESIYKLLKDVRYAMEVMNDMYTKGVLFEKWPTESDPEGTLVATYFKMPFPFTDREFVHGLHSTQLNDHTWLVGYTPVENDTVPAEADYIRCKTYISGQRITQLPNGTCKVEHLMVYELGGSVSKAVQDKWFKQGHVGAYVKEWRNLRPTTFPATVADISNDRLVACNQYALQQSAAWPVAGKIEGGVVKTGRLSFCPNDVYRLEYDMDMSLDDATELIGYQHLEHLPNWNKEFMEGSVLETLPKTDRVDAWIMRVRYATPAILDNREYVYCFSVTKISDEETIISYQSVDHYEPAPSGNTRAWLYPSVHQLLSINGKTKVTHLLATDLRGNLGPYQDKLLKGGLVKAQLRDIESQLKMVGRQV